MNACGLLFVCLQSHKSRGIEILWLYVSSRLLFIEFLDCYKKKKSSRSTVGVKKRWMLYDSQCLYNLIVCARHVLSAAFYSSHQLIYICSVMKMWLMQ